MIGAPLQKILATIKNEYDLFGFAKFIGENSELKTNKN